MKMSILSSRPGLLGLILISLMTMSCASNPTGSQQADHFLEIHADGRIHIFYDKPSYDEFLALGETSYRLTRIGAGPGGETLIFGLPATDKKKSTGIPSIDIYDGKRNPDHFYGEMRKQGRIFVFSAYEDMKMVRETGEAALRYSDIGSGPEGETVIYVLNHDSKKGKPTAMIAQFREFNAIN